MGRGFLTGKITKAEDFDGSSYFVFRRKLDVAHFLVEGDHRRHFTRFKKEVPSLLLDSFYEQLLTREARTEHRAQLRHRRRTEAHR